MTRPDDSPLTPPIRPEQVKPGDPPRVVSCRDIWRDPADGSFWLLQGAPTSDHIWPEKDDVVIFRAQADGPEIVFPRLPYLRPMLGRLGSRPDGMMPVAAYRLVDVDVDGSAILNPIKPTDSVPVIRYDYGLVIAQRLSRSDEQRPVRNTFGQQKQLRQVLGETGRRPILEDFRHRRGVDRIFKQIYGAQRQDRKRGDVGPGRGLG